MMLVLIKITYSWDE